MFGLKLKDAKSMFFDRAAVTSAVDKATRTVLGKFGAYVRRAARASIKNAQKHRFQVNRRQAIPEFFATSFSSYKRHRTECCYWSSQTKRMVGPVRLDRLSRRTPQKFLSMADTRSSHLEKQGPKKVCQGTALYVACL